MNKIIRLCLTTVLIVAGVEDYRNREIHIWYVVLDIVICIIMRLVIAVSGEKQISFFASMVPGIAIMIYSSIMPKYIGMGDGLMLIAIGGAVGPEIMYRIVVRSIFISMGIIILVLLKRGNNKEGDIPSIELPFITILCIGYLYDVMLGAII